MGWFKLSSVGAGVTGTNYNGIRDMKATAGGLVVVGDFSEMGSAAGSSNAAVWNGSQWTGLNLNHGDNFVNCVEVYNSKIYVGTFSFTHSHLYRYNGPLGINEMNVTDNNIMIYPNPAKDKITIDESLQAAPERTCQFTM